MVQVIETRDVTITIVPKEDREKVKKDTIRRAPRTVRTVPTKTKETYVALVVDSSGSMSSMKEQALALFNNQIDVLKATPKDAGTTFVSFFTFGEQNEPLRPVPAPFQSPYTSLGWVPGFGSNWAPKVKFLHKSTKALKHLTPENYKPYGNTPMYDGIGLAITELEGMANPVYKDQAFLVIVVTDGQENASYEWSGPQLSQKIVELQNTGLWTFTVLGTNVDLAELSRVTGIPVANTYTYSNDSVGYNSASNSLGHSTQGYLRSRGAGATASLDFFSVNEDSKPETLNNSSLSSPIVKAPKVTLPKGWQSEEDILPLNKD